MLLQAFLSIDPLILATALALLVFVLAMRMRRRRALRQAERARLQAEAANQASGETSVLPLAQLAESVEVLDLDDLLAEEESTVAAAARRQLEAPTDVATEPDSFFPLPKVLKRAPAQPAARVEPVLQEGVLQEVAVQEPNLAPVALSPPVRELALAWFEARGYRASSASRAVRPIELVLRHRNDPSRAYAFIVERQQLNVDRVEELVEHAHSIGLTKVLIAVETAVEASLARHFRRRGVRVVDREEMRREFDKVDLRVAAKIIAVARSRAKLRTRTA